MERGPEAPPGLSARAGAEGLRCRTEPLATPSRGSLRPRPSAGRASVQPSDALHVVRPLTSWLHRRPSVLVVATGSLRHRARRLARVAYEARALATVP